MFYWSLLYEYFILTQSSDVRLQDSQERMLAYERRSNEHTKLIAELTQKVRQKRSCQVTEQLYPNLLARKTDCYKLKDSENKLTVPLPRTNYCKIASAIVAKLSGTILLVT